MKETQSIFIHIPKTGGKSVITSLYKINLHETFGHATPELYLAIFGPRLFNKFFKFAFVRNPWDRLYSAFNFYQQGGFVGKEVKKIKKEIYGLNFESFVKGWLPETNIEQWTLLRPQYQFVCNQNDQVILDKVFYFEQLQEDYSYLNSRLGIKSELSHINKSLKSVSYIDVYDEEMKKMIEELYEKDIQLFCYSFYNYHPK